MLLSSLIPKIHEYLVSARGSQPDSQDPTKYAYKRYERMEQIPLARSPHPDVTLAEVLETRRSVTSESMRSSLELSDLAGILRLACEPRDDGRRPYPSGGSLFPVELYVLAKSVRGIDPGVYHYAPTEHSLEHLWDIPENIQLFGGGGTAPSVNAWVEQSPAICILTGAWERSSVKYGDFAYLLTVLEAGHIGQNIQLAAQAYKVGSRPLGGFNHDATQRILDISADREQALYAVMLA